MLEWTSTPSRPPCSHHDAARANAASLEAKLGSARQALAEAETAVDTQDWEGALRHWVDRHLGLGEHDLLDEVTPRFERIMIETALKHSGGHRQDAAKLLGWGRNTLTRKIKELGMEEAV